MMDIIISGTLDLEGRTVEFDFDGKRINLINESPELFAVPCLPKHYDVVYGKCRDRKTIVFLDVNYFEERASIASSGWALSCSRKIPDSLDVFDSIRFTGKPIDAFFPPKYALRYQKAHIDTNDEQFDGIMPKPWKDIVRKFDFKINDDIIHGRLDVYIKYNLRSNERMIGEVTSILSLRFPSPQPFSTLPQYYLYIFDLMKFISFRGNICFDSIELYKQEETQPSHSEKVATAEFFVRDSAEEYARKEQNVITFEDVAFSISPFIEHVVQRRLNRKIDSLFIPQTDKEYRSIDHSLFLSCALSFEGEFHRRFGEKKAESDALFSKIKQEAFDAIEKIKAAAIRDNVDRVTDVKDFCGQFKQAVAHTEFTLSEKFEYARKEYASIVDDYFQRIVSAEYADDEECWGKVLSKMRNSIGHGEPLLMERKHIAVFQMTHVQTLLVHDSILLIFHFIRTPLSFLICYATANTPLAENHS